MKTAHAMVRSMLITLCAGMALTACGSPTDTVPQVDTVTHDVSRPDTLTLVDTLRHRSIPIAYYHPVIVPEKGPARLVIISHGYGENKPGTYLHFSSLAGHLALEGIAVVSIQHELPTDALLPMKGDLRVLRRPNWERGVHNILFVLSEIRRKHPELGNANVALVGHSNGGDMSMLFAEQHPQLITTAISLDNRRMPLPRVREPRICSLRAYDAHADEGVLPTPEEQVEFGIRIIQLPGTRHVDMDDRATAEQRKELNALIVELLAD